MKRALLLSLILLAACSGKPANPLIGSWKLVGGWREFPDSPLMCPAETITFTADSQIINYAANAAGPAHTENEPAQYNTDVPGQVSLAAGMGAITWKLLPGGHIQLDAASACEYAKT